MVTQATLSMMTGKGEALVVAVVVIPPAAPGRAGSSRRSRRVPEAGIATVVGRVE
jgi:hypothetical protein